MIAHRFLLTNGEIADLCSNAGQRHFVALLDIGRATDDAKFLCTCIHACVAEMVRAGYFFQVSNLGGDDVLAPIGSYIFDSFNFQPGHGQRVRQCFRRHCYVNIFFQPA